MNTKQTTIWGIATLYAVFLTGNPVMLFVGIFIGAYISKRIETKKSKKYESK
jgi:uncharacterized protein YneF (UPF0154 family)